MFSLVFQVEKNVWLSISYLIINNKVRPEGHKTETDFLHKYF